MVVTPLEKLLAFKALVIAKGLSVSERRVAAALVDHFNGVSGRCDPSIDCLAEELDIDRRTVLRSVRKLNRLEIIFKDRHQGRHRTNSYEPNWPKLKAMLAGWRLGRRRNRRKEGATEPSPREGQSCPSSGDTADTQIYSRNLVQESICDVDIDEDDKSRLGETMLGGGQARRTLAKSHRGARSISSRESADQSALQRWQGDLLEHDANLFQAIVVAVDDTATEEITAAEVRRHGGGLEYILEHRADLVTRQGSHD